MSDIFGLTFEKLCHLYMDDVLLRFGYMYHAHHLRSHGISLEYSCDLKCCFIVCEGDTVYIDVIFPHYDGGFYRVSINQALWFGGVKAVSQSLSVKEQLVLFASELKLRCSAVLLGDISRLDTRYCFKMSQAEHDDYIAAQTGEMRNRGRSS